MAADDRFSHYWRLKKQLPKIDDTPIYEDESLLKEEWLKLRKAIQEEAKSAFPPNTEKSED
ncbi:hypothetical protein P4637_09055 [Halalkalibacterium halodurans]|jgi:hypothetical protein|uniref:BH2914 protein n=2 Tax=Halalkalibacterium halodurans TaxID=86665 RepID=Q9K8T8_HALH5|nr:hypothetical protein [Halalkalibacterium halodurans]MDY7223466.1 hypothetical protein [Halalkalibacterium halodurans]MDY7242687.1 hypothetical protein [Halalkalibacterium halodurans]MED3645339.1 hypothetical protein [Halalkalibacterium halodurans]MED4081606.1 hypothetical protein [Halalkalibacterium halodurans]MED4084982.1 hypothetical protein [Halalkalibacterium halodurans]